MKIIHKGKDITEIVSKVNWSGDVKQASRILDFNIAVSPTDYFLPTVTLAMEDMIKVLDDNDKEIFQGYVFNKDKSISSSEMSITCYDGLIYMLRSKGKYNFKDMTPDAITRKVAGDFGIEVGSLETGSPLSRIFEKESIYKIIMTAYTIESNKSGKQFMLKMNNGKLDVILKGKHVAKYELDTKSTIIDSTYGESMENSINKVKIYDTEGNSKGEVNLSGLSGVLQDIYKEEEGVDIMEGAKGLLQDIEKTASIKALGNFECVTGNAVIIKEPFTGLSGLFYIDNDSHTFENRQHIMDLNLAFKNIMDTQMGGQDPAELEANRVSESGVGGSGSSGSALCGNTNEEKIWHFFRGQGFSETATAGVMGNLKQESQLDHTRKQGGGGPGRGLMQWETGHRGNNGRGRWNHLEDWAKGAGKDKWALETQLEYIMKELTGDAEDKYNAQILNRRFGGLSGLKGMSIDNALNAFEKSMERAGRPMMSQRRKYANAIYSKHRGSTCTPTSSQASVATKIDKMIRHAESMVGFKYSQKNRFGSSSADCSSLVIRSMMAAGITNDNFLVTASIARDKRFQEVPKSQIRRGDVVWESGHMALFIGNNTLVEASTSKMVVRYSKYNNRFTKVYRIKGV